MPLRHLIVLIANIHLLAMSCAKHRYKYQQKDQLLEIYPMARLSFQSFAEALSFPLRHKLPLFISANFQDFR